MEATPSTKIKEYFDNDGTAWITPKDLALNVDNKFISKGETNVSEKGIKAASLKIMPKGTLFPRFKRCEINIGKLLYLNKYFGKQNNKKILNHVTKLIMKEIAKLAKLQYKY